MLDHSVYAFANTATKIYGSITKGAPLCFFFLIYKGVASLSLDPDYLKERARQNYQVL